MATHHYYDALIIGSGAAGLSMALHLSPNAKVAVLSKRELTSGSTWLAQGGIAAVLDTTDTTQAHIEDTMIAGGNLSHKDAVEFTVNNGKANILSLIHI